MKILLINAPIRLSAKPNCLPYGLAVVAAILREQGHNVDILDINALRLSEEGIIDSLKHKKWDVAGVSGLITTFSFQQWIISELKKLIPSAPVISGGGLATSIPEFLFENSAVDIAVIGEGERTMPELLKAIEDGSDLSGVNGIWFRHGEELIVNAKRQNVKELDVLPFPAWDLLPMDIYLKHPVWGDAANNSSGFKKDVSVSRSMNIISSRGCPYSCNYCYHLFGKSSYRFRSAQNIINEMEMLINEYNVDFIGFNDDNMMASEKRLIKFCELLKAKKWSISWGCHGRVTSAKPHILEKMAETGCVWIGYGIESGSQKMLDAMNKKATVEQAKEAIINTREAGIYPNTTFIFGYPGETIESIHASIDFKKEMGLDCHSFFATPYPGTELYSRFKGRISDYGAYIKSLGDATEFCINLTDFDDDVLFSLKRNQDANNAELEISVCNPDVLVKSL